MGDTNLSADDGLAEVRHQPNKRGVPLVGDLREGRASRRHQHLPDAVLERPDRRVVHPQERLVDAKPELTMYNHRAHRISGA